MDFEVIDATHSTGSQTSPEVTLESWLTSLGLGEFHQQFVEQGFDLPLIKAQGLDEEDLVAVGVTKRGHIKKLISAAADLKRASHGMWRVKLTVIFFSSFF